MNELPLAELPVWEGAEKLDLRCIRCGYGAVRWSAPERCPMCQAVDAWIHASQSPPRTTQPR